MEHILELEGKGLQRLYDFVFPNIAGGRTILFLGAGAAVTDKKKFLSKQLIELYSAKNSIDLETNDIIDFVDALSSNTSFSRDDFDNFVDDLLRGIKTNDTHKIIACLNWKEIITTNFDLLIERAFDEIIDTPDKNLKLFPVRKASDYYYKQDREEVKYVKLNGCISDKKQYPLVFSSKDFERAGPFYKTVLRTLENLSPKVMFLSVGFSYSDDFSKELLKRFDRYNYRNRRWIFSIDPFVEDARLAHYSENRICIIRVTAERFFQAYMSWAEDNAANIAIRRRISFVNKENRRIQIPNQLAIRIANDLIQISDSYSLVAISPESFYRGEHPTFAVIRKNLDVVKHELLKRVIERANELLAKQLGVVPILFLVGSYGTGKTTLCYRIINELIHNEEFDALGFEVIDASKLKAVDLEVLFTNAQSQNIILFFNGIELDSAFKSLIDFRAKISQQQFHDFKVLVLASIRENILVKYKARHSYINTVELNVDEPFNEAEAQDLVEKLSAAKLLDYRDARGRNALVQKIINEYSGDTLISLISLVSESSNDQILRDAYLQLSSLAQNAFLFTSLLYRFNIKMPASLLRSLVAKTWEQFTEEVLEYDSKGILIQEESTGVGTNPDIYLRTKHPIISDSLVKKLQLPNEDLRFEKYKELVQHLNPSAHSSSLVVDLLKAIRDGEDLSGGKIDNLFDACSQIFYEDPHFNLHYAINLQYRNTEDSLRKGIERIQHAEGFLERRNHYLTHRKAVLNFRLAILVSGRETELNETFEYVEHARNLFDIKLILDPFSSYSYIEYIRLEMWCLETIVLDELSEIRQRIVVEELLDKAEKALIENTHIIAQLKAEYLHKTKTRSREGQDEYLSFLDEISQDPVKRPYAFILKFYFYQSHQDEERCFEAIQELESYTHLDEVVKVLFRYYGRHLYDANTRLKFIEITNKHEGLEKKDPARYHYYLFIAHAYNRNFQFAYDQLNVLRSRFNHFSPELSQLWIDSDTFQEKVFESVIVISKGRKRARVIDLQQTVDLVSGDYTKVSENSHRDVVLHFLLNGMRAEIVAPIREPDNASALC